jgi:hypothetical protein
MNDLRRGAGVLILAALSLGCGGCASDGGGGTVPPPGCGKVNPCGGDLIGTWKVLGGCSDALSSDSILTCPPNTPEDVVGLDYAGTVTFNSDMTYTTNFVGTSGGSYTIPPSCLPGGVACADVFPGCSGESICTCPAVGAYASIIAGAGAIAGSGTYSIAGDELTFSPPTASILGITYCVQNGFLHLETNTTVMQSDGTFTMPITSDIVAKMQ